MAKPLDPKFKLMEGDGSVDLDEIFALLEVAFGDDAVWKSVFKDCKDDEIHSWIMSVLAPRWAFPDITLYKIVELSSGRITGWTALQFPWVDRPLTEEQLAMVNSHELPPGINGMNMEALVTFMECLSFAKDYGYDPMKDYHRKGTMIHPDFQRKGFGIALTHHCNAISDRTGGKTWVPARHKSINMFRQCGFKDVSTHNARLERFGGKAEENTTWLVVREAPK